MLVIVKNTEEILYKELKGCWEKFPTHRCLHLKFSQIEQNQEEWRERFLDILQSEIDDRLARTYICYDQDIFVLTRYMTGKSVSKLLQQLAPLFNQKDIEKYAALYETGVDWPKLRTLCEKKIENFHVLYNSSPAQTEKEEFNISKQEALSALDVNLISSLSTRRKQRENPVIMVVEDDVLSQKLVGNALKNKYPLAMTADGQGALMNYVTRAPDVLFLDIGLPDMNGHDVLKKIFEIDPQAYVVMFSGKGDKSNVIKAVELGASGFIGKPFAPEKLFQYIEKSPFIQAKHKKEGEHGHRLN